MKKTKAILLLGPTGSGKSPIGNLISNKTGWFHLDFGHCLRTIASDTKFETFTKTEIAYIQHLIDSYSLFPDEKTDLAIKIINHFLDTSKTRVVLNGFPRSTVQAEAIKQILTIDFVFCLCAEPETLIQRIMNRKKGLSSDHSNRTDDKISAISKKLEIFHQTTLPLIDYYNKSGTITEKINITEESDETSIANNIVNIVQK